MKEYVVHIKQIREKYNSIKNYENYFTLKNAIMHYLRVFKKKAAN